MFQKNNFFKVEKFEEIMVDGFGGEVEGNNQRIIRVGFLRPKIENQEIDTIYVVERKQLSSTWTYAEATSKTDFNFDMHSPDGKKYNETGRFASNLYLNAEGRKPHIDLENDNLYAQTHTSFIEMLGRKNNGRINYEFEEDGLNLMKNITAAEGNMEDFRKRARQMGIDLSLFEDIENMLRIGRN